MKVHRAGEIREWSGIIGRIKASPKEAFTLVECMIVVAVIGLLAAIAIPSLIHARTSAQQNACINNLHQIDAAKQQWAFEAGLPPTARPGTAEIAPYLGQGAGSPAAECYCPVDPSRTIQTSYQVGSMSISPVCLVVPAAHVAP